MKVILAGDYIQPIYQQAFKDALEKLGHEVIPFKFGDYFFHSFIGKVEYHFTWQLYHARKLNKKLIRLCKKENPYLVFIWRGTHIVPQTIIEIKKYTKAVVSYNNDDPFSEAYQKGSIHLKNLWNIFKKGIKYFDINFVYRPQNIIDFNHAGSQNTKLLLPYYISSELNKTHDTEPDIDVLFIGRNEADRYDYIKYLIEQCINVKVIGSNWPEECIKGKHYLAMEARGQAYYQYLKKAKISLAFFSKLNQDVYTRRSFEIPVSSQVMVSEYSEEIASLFLPDIEAVYFKTKEEMAMKVKKLLQSESERKKIHVAAKLRSEQSGYEVLARVKQFMQEINQWVDEKNN